MKMRGRGSRGLVAVAILVGSVVGTSDPSLAIDERLAVLTSTFTTRIGERVIISVAPPTTPDVLAALTDPLATAVASVSTPLVARQAVVDIVAGGEFEAEAATSLGGPLFRAVTLGNRDAFQLVITTSANRRSGVLQLSRAGLRALRITLTSTTGRTAAFTTFINVVSSQSVSSLPVTFVATLDTTPLLQPDGSIVVNETQREQLRNLRDLLLRKPPNLPIAVRVRPELLSGLARSSEATDQALLAELAALLTTNDVLVGTFRPTDVASYAAAGLRTEFEAQLLRGESILDEVNGAALSTRALWLTNESIDVTSVDFLRTLGVTNVLAVGKASVAFGAEIDPNRPYAVRSDTKGVVLHLSDSRYSTLLDTPIGTAYESATAIAAELIAQRNELAGSPVGPAVLSSRHVLLVSDAGVPPQPLIAAIVLRHLSTTPQIALRRVSELAASLEGLPRITPPIAPLIDVLTIQSQTNDVVGKVELVRDVLATNDGLVDRWIELVDTANDTSLSDAQRALYLDNVLTQATGVRNAVKLPNTSFTFGSRESELRLALNNTSAFAVSMRIRLTSPTGKMDFSPVEMDVFIPALGQQELTVVANARTNGLIPVELVLTSPTGTVLDVALIRVRVNAIAGLGRGVSVVFLALLAAWWAIHTRRQMKKKNAIKHPALRSQS